ncbi:hypothetical protein ACOME3_003747 [Neoechinorhynchus agilis]
MTIFFHIATQQCPNSPTPKCRSHAETEHSSQSCLNKSIKRCANCNGCSEFKKYWSWAPAHIAAKLKCLIRQCIDYLNAILPRINLSLNLSKDTRADNVDTPLSLRILEHTFHRDESVPVPSSDKWRGLASGRASGRKTLSQRHISNVKYNTSDRSGWGVPFMRRANPAPWVCEKLFRITGSTTGEGEGPKRGGRTV